MLTPKNNVVLMRQNIDMKVAESFLQRGFSDLDELPEKIVSDQEIMRGSVAKDIQAVKEQIMALLGFVPALEDVHKPLSDFAAQALKREKAPVATVSVLPSVCEACMQTRLTVTEMCRGCFARPCAVNCPKKTITVESKAFIHQENCIKCGLCATVCPYGAINKAVVPCEEACPVGALSKDENGVEHIDPNKCISCGKCVLSCPFGAIAHNSQMIDVLNAVKNGKREVVAMLAPAVIGQFGNDINKVIGALEKVGFADVVEVAEGADMTITNEAEEFVERMKEGAPFMTTSCCPAWMKAADTAIPEIKPYISNAGSPVYYMAEIVKSTRPNCVSVFVGPCLAKRLEAEKNDNIDYVLVFEELQAILAGSSIDVASAESVPFAKVSSAQGRIFPLSGGVAGAVAHMVDNQVDYRPDVINGLNKESIRKLKTYAAKKSAGEFNMIEVMCCENGCVGGPGCVVLPKKSAVMVEAYVKTSPDLKDLQGK